MKKILFWLLKLDKIFVSSVNWFALYLSSLESMNSSLSLNDYQLRLEINHTRVIKMWLRASQDMHSFNSIFKSLNRLETFQQVGCVWFSLQRGNFLFFFQLPLCLDWFESFLTFFLRCKGQWTIRKQRVFHLEENSNYVTNKSWRWKLLNFNVIYCTIFIWTMKTRNPLCAKKAFYALLSFLPHARLV